MKEYFRNTLINLFAFGTGGAVNLVLVPAIVSAYGIERYGLIMLARTLLPGAMLGLLDFGATDATTRYVASSMAEGDRRKAGHSVMLSLLIVIPIAIAISLTGVLGTNWVTISLLGMSAQNARLMNGVIFWTGLAALVTLPGMVCEGALRGLERFDVVRSAELLTSFVYAAATILFIYNGNAFDHVAYAFLAVITARYSFFALYLFSTGIEFSPHGLGARHCKAHILLLYRVSKAKLLSLLLGGLAPILISHFLGASAVGLFDATIRIPRVVTAMIGRLSQVIIPISARLESSGDEVSMVRIIIAATRFNLLATAPPLLAVMFFAESFFVSWLGPEYAAHAKYFALMLLWPLVQAVTAVGNTMLLGRADAFEALNRITMTQVAVYYMVAFALLRPLSEAAFFVATIVALLVTAPFRVLIVRQQYSLPANWPTSIVGRILLAGLPAALLAHALASFVQPSDMWGTLAVIGVMVLGQWLAAVVLLVTPSERRIARVFFFKSTSVRG